MNTADTTENTEKKTSALPAKKVSDSETHQLHVVIHPDINGFPPPYKGKQNCSSALTMKKQPN